MNQPGDVYLRSKGLSIQLTARVPAAAGVLRIKYTLFHVSSPILVLPGSISSQAFFPISLLSQTPALVGAVL